MHAGAGLRRRLVAGGRGTGLLPLVWLVAALVAALAGVGAAHAGELRVEGAWARPTPPGISRTAVYLHIHNIGSAEERLVAVSSAVAGRTEVHETVMRDGMMEMRPLALPLAIPPGGTFSFRPGGAHVMLLALKAPIARGAQVPLTLRFARAGELRIEAEARDTPPPGFKRGGTDGER